MEENVPKQATEPMPSSEKTKKKSPVLTIILILFTIAGIGFGVYGMCFNKPAEKECIESEVIAREENNNGSEDYTIYYDLVKKYFISSGYLNVSSYEEGDFTDINYMMTVLYDNNKITIDRDKTYPSGVIYSTSEVKKALKDFFNYENDIDEFEIKCNGKFKFIPQDAVAAHYKSIYSDYGCGGAGDTYPAIEITNVQRNEGQLFIDVSYSRIATSPDGAKVFDTNFESEAEAEQYFVENLDKASKYKLTFKKADKHYYLESGEKIN